MTEEAVNAAFRDWGLAGDDMTRLGFDGAELKICD